MTDLELFIELLSGCRNPAEGIVSCAQMAFKTSVTVKEERMNAGMMKYKIHGLPFDAVVHHFTAPDTGLPHDHPWGFTTHILKGSYSETNYYLKNPTIHRSRLRAEGTSHHVDADTIHLLSSLPEGDCWTLVLPEAWQKEPGFYRFEDGNVYHRFHHETEFRLIERANQSALDTVVTQNKDGAVREGFAGEFSFDDLAGRGVKSVL